MRNFDRRRAASDSSSRTRSLSLDLFARDPRLLDTGAWFQRLVHASGFGQAAACVAGGRFVEYTPEQRNRMEVLLTMLCERYFPASIEPSSGRLVEEVTKMSPEAYRELNHRLLEDFRRVAVGRLGDEP